MSQNSQKSTLAEAYLSKIAALDEELPTFGAVRGQEQREVSPFPSPKKQHQQLAEIEESGKGILDFPELKVPETKDVKSPSSPVKSTERAKSSVQALIKAKENETKHNNAVNYTPRPDNMNLASHKNVFVSKNAPLPQANTNNTIKNNINYIPKLVPTVSDKEDKLSKSERNRMGKINTVMSSSPSMKTVLVANLPPQSPPSKVTPLSVPNGVLKSWIDSNRDNLKLALFVCRMLEIKRWIELVLNEPINLQDHDIDQFPDYLVNGVLISRIAKKFNPQSVKKIWTCDGYDKFDSLPMVYQLKRRDFKYIQNIGQFLSFTSQMKLPTLFIFETNDLYEMIDIPKVIACLHALACMLSLNGLAPPVTRIDKNELCLLSEKYFNIDKLKSINYKVGRSLSSKYLDGFEEAVRVNGGHIKSLELVAISKQKKQDSTVTKTDNTTVNENARVSDDNKEERVFDEQISLSTVESNVSNVSTLSIDDPVTPPSEEQLEDARRARAFFNAPIPRSATLPRLDSITAIHEKYKYLLKADEQALLSGTPLSNSTIKRATEEVDEEALVRFQSLARGYLLRFDIFVNKFMLKNNASDIISFQAICRGALKRNQLKKRLPTSESFYSSSQMMKTLYRNKTKYSKSLDTKIGMKSNESSIIRLQAISRGNVVRNKHWEIRKHLLKNIKVVIDLQSRARGELLRIKLSSNSPFTPILRPTTPELLPSNRIDNSNEDGGLFESYRKISSSLSTSAHAQKAPLTPPQSASHVIPRIELKKQHAKLIPNLPLSEFEVNNLQIESSSEPKQRKKSKLHLSPTKKRLSSFIPPADSRVTSCETTLVFKPKMLPISLTDEQRSKLKDFDEDIRLLQSYIRGNMLRRKVRKIKQHLTSYAKEITQVIATYRAIETRFAIDIRKLDLRDEEEKVILFQSQIRRYLVQKRIKDKEEWYLRPDNLEKIIKVQAFLRRFRDQKNYKALIEEKNPPFTSIQKFSKLLNGFEAGKVIEESLEIINMKEECKLERSRLIQSLDKLKDIQLKIDILKSNGVKLKGIDDFKAEWNQHANKLELSRVGKGVLEFAQEEESKLIEQSMANNVLMQKKDKELLSIYGRFFSALQSKPEYWSKVIYELMRGDIEVQFSHGHLEDWVLKCFNYNELNDTSVLNREEGQLLKMIWEVLKMYLNVLGPDDFKLAVKNRRDITYDNIKIWELILMAFTNLPQQRKAIKDEFGELIFLITGDDDAWFECDPDVIRDQLEIYDLSVDAIDIPRVKKQYIENLSLLKTNVDEIFNKLDSCVDKIPVFLRSFMREVFTFIKARYSNVSDTYWYGFAGSILMKDYLIPMFLTPGNYSIDIYALSEEYEDIERVQRNMDLVASVMLQSVLMKPFSASQNPYLLPLNSFILGKSDTMRSFLDKVMDVGDLDHVYHKVSMVQTESFLKIKVDDLMELINIWTQFLEQFFNNDDGDLLEPLTVLAEYDNASRRPKGDHHGFVEFLLLETAKREVSNDAHIKAIWLELKRYLIYILQVQFADNLIDVLLCGITPADEAKFMNIIKTERMVLKDRGIKAENEVYRLPYPLVKERAINLINELEDAGVVDYRDGYQAILNELAKDIKTKRDQRNEIETEKREIVDILTELKRKNKTYEKKCIEYSRNINFQLQQINLSKHKTNNRNEDSGIVKRSIIKKFFRSSIGKNDKHQLTLTFKQLKEKGIISDKVRHKTNLEVDLNNTVFEFKLSGDTATTTLELDDLIRWQYDKGHKDILGLEVDAQRLSKSVIQHFYKA